MAKKMYQVWALLRGENGTERWQAVTRKYAVKKSAQNMPASGGSKPGSTSPRKRRTSRASPP